MLGDAISIHGDLVAEIRGRHPRLWAERRRLRAHSREPLRVKAALTLVGALPFVSEFTRLRLSHAVSRPGEVLAMRRLRRSADR
jgi:hypothetical protein